jgi:SAM-dependent methyltransferase
MSHTGMNGHQDVARYYDRNTTRFLRFGGGARARAIHRELWGPGVGSTTDAKRYVNRLVGDEIESAGIARPVVLDLGCGVGGTLFDLATRFPAGTMHGVTISARQHELAQRWSDRVGIGERCVFHIGDFHDLELGPPHDSLRAHVVVAIESFAHASDPTAFFATVARHLDPERGRVVVIDDFLADERGKLSPTDHALIDRFEEGWRLGTLQTPTGCQAAAAAAGLEALRDWDLTPLIRLGRPRDRVIAAVAPALDRLGLAGVPFCGNMIGGDALQAGIRKGVFSYRMLTFELAAPDQGRP